MKTAIKTTIQNPVKTSDTAQERLNYLHDTYGLTWREIANLDDYRPIPFGSLCTFATTGYMADKWRVRLGLPIEGRVQVIFGMVPDGSQVIAADQCECGQWYVSNHPARHKCFICSPFRRRSKSS